MRKVTFCNVFPSARHVNSQDNPDLNITLTCKNRRPYGQMTVCPRRVFMRFTHGELTTVRPYSYGENPCSVFFLGCWNIEYGYEL